MAHHINGNNNFRSRQSINKLICMTIITNRRAFQAFREFQNDKQLKPIDFVYVYQYILSNGIGFWIYYIKID